MVTTIKDIAKAANVSQMTVSRALNDSPLVKLETKEYIKKLADELNYKPNYHAKGLVLKRSYNIGLFFTSLTKGTSPEFFYEVVNIVNDEVKENYNLVVRSISDKADFDCVNTQRFDGILVLSQSDRDDEFIYRVRDMGIPVVCINRKVDEVTSIYSNDALGMGLCLHHLLETGYKDIAFIEGCKSFTSNRVRRQGIDKVLKEDVGIMYSTSFEEGDYSYESGFTAMEKLLKQEDKPEAICCFNDDMAIGAMCAIREAGLEIPRDIALTGFDGSLAAAYAYPTLTTVHRPVDKMAKMGIDALIQTIKGDDTIQHISLEPKLIIRKSS